MKSIELTEDQKSKLLEMCKVLFPEYEFIHFQDSAIMGAGWDYDFNNICFSKKSNSIYDIEINIHWFEFCVKILIPKIFSDEEYDTFSDNSLLEIAYIKLFDQNPIEYCYKQFKTLKL